MPKSAHQMLEIVFLCVAGLVASLWLAPSPSHAQAEPAATHNNGWSFVDVARVGQNGFTQLDVGRAGPDGEVVVSGVHNGRTGLFLVENNVVTAVAVDGQVLPGGLGTLGDIGAFSFQYAILPDGDVVFKARATDGSLSPAFLYTFRWSNGAITVAQPSQEIDPVTLNQAFDHDLAQVTTDNRWLATLQTGSFPNTTADYGLTDGAARQSIFSFTRSAANCIFDTVTLAAANANGVVAYYQLLQTTPQAGNRCANELGTTRTWSVKLAGAATGTIASGSSFEQVNTYTGAELSISNLFLMNNQNQVAAVRELHNSPTTFPIRGQLVVFKNGSEEIIQDTDGPASGIFMADFDQQGRVLYSVELDDSVTTALLGGPDLENDRVLRTGDPLFGQAVTALSWVARPAAAGDGEARAFAFQYGLDNGAAGIALARQQRPRWTNPAGGDWGGAANWTPADVPSAGDGVRFDLGGAYAVNLGAHQVGSVQVRNGDVTFRNGELNTTTDGGSISIDGDTAEAVARLTIRDTGAVASTVVTAATVSLGFGGPGELRIENARLIPPENAERAAVTLGFAAPATATVTAGGIWNWREMSLGMNQDSLLRVEDGAFVGFGADRLIVGGSSLAFPVRNQTATAIVDNASNNAGLLGVGAQLGIVTDLVIGESLIGNLEIKNGARAVAVTTTVGTRDHGTRTDGFLTVEGTNPTLPARFESGGEEGGGLFVATGAGTDALVTVSGGGVMTLARLSLADGAQSSALMFVDGMEAVEGGERRSTVTAPFPPQEPEPEAGLAAAAASENGDCIIGRAGRGTLNVSNGGLVRCRQIAVGFGAGSRGEVNIDGILRSVNAHLVADGSRAEDGVICIGGVPLCGATSNNVRGEVVIGVDGILEGRIIGVGRGGRIRGSGLAITADGVVVIDGGSVAPGIVQLEGSQRTVAAGSAASQEVGTLTIQGNLTVSETGFITLHVLGGTADLQDRLVVSGTAALHGQMALNFGNGYAPQQGEQLTLIQATSVTGAPQAVVITGLAPGFQYDLNVAGGVLTLTALNDGVPTTQVFAPPIYLPLIMGPGW